MEDKEFIERVRLAREDEVRFFSNAAKPARERWIVREFLQRLDMSISEGDLQSLPEDDDVDVFVECLDAAFQVKELPEANCLRSSEVKAALKRAETALQPMDLYEPLVAMDKIWVDAYPLILECATAAKYPAPSRAMSRRASRPRRDCRRCRRCSRRTWGWKTGPHVRPGRAGTSARCFARR